MVSEEGEGKARELITKWRRVEDRQRSKVEQVVRRVAQLLSMPAPELVEDDLSTQLGVVEKEHIRLWRALRTLRLQLKGLGDRTWQRKASSPEGPHHNG